MNPTKPTIAVSTYSNSPVFTVTLETIGIFTGTLVSISILATVAIKLISNLNHISNSITQIKEDLKEHANNAEKVRELDKKFDLHTQEYINRKDVIQMVLGQLDQKIDHKFKRVLFYTRDIQRFLQRDTAFQIREYEENTENE
jgi:hypothetical protein